MQNNNKTQTLEKLKSTYISSGIATDILEIKNLLIS